MMKIKYCACEFTNGDILMSRSENTLKRRVKEHHIFFPECRIKRFFKHIEEVKKTRF